jgi:hypothetical protein
MFRFIFISLRYVLLKNVKLYLFKNSYQLEFYIYVRKVLFTMPKLCIIVFIVLVVQSENCLH